MTIQKQQQPYTGLSETEAYAYLARLSEQYEPVAFGTEPLSAEEWASLSAEELDVELSLLGSSIYETRRAIHADFTQTKDILDNALQRLRNIRKIGEKMPGDRFMAKTLEIVGGKTTLFRRDFTENARIFGATENNALDFENALLSVSPAHKKVAESILLRLFETYPWPPEKEGLPLSSAPISGYEPD